MASFPSSYIVTTTASATRAADVLTVPVSGIDYPLSLYAEFERAVATAASDIWLSASAGVAPTDRSWMGASAGATMRQIMTSGGAAQADISGVAFAAVGARSRVAGRFAANDVRASCNGTLNTADTTATVPSAPTALNFANPNGAGGSESFGYLRRAALFTRALTDAELTALTL